MSLSATLFGRDSLIFKATNILGLGVPGLLDKWFGAQDPEGPRLGDISQQTAKEGDPRVIVWGRVRPIGGNIIHSQTPVKRWIKQKVEGGKGGGGKKTQYVENVFRTYAIGVCEGPISGFVRIWRNNKLVYDARGNEWGEENNPVFLSQYRLFLGTWDQLPSPDLENVWGVGEVPAYRGTAYIVAADENLTETGGMIPQWQFEVERSEGTYLTSKPYAIEQVDSLDHTPGIGKVSYRATRLFAEGSDAMSFGAGVGGLSFKDAVIRYDSRDEALDFETGINELVFDSTIVPTPEVEDGETLDFQAGISGMIYKLTRVSYTEPNPESFEFGAGVTGLNYDTPS